ATRQQRCATRNADLTFHMRNLSAAVVPCPQLQRTRGRESADARTPSNALTSAAFVDILDTLSTANPRHSHVCTVRAELARVDVLSLSTPRSFVLAPER